MALSLPAALGPLVRSAADGDGRYSINGVQVTDRGRGQFCCVSTDGRNLLIARGLAPDGVRGRLQDCAPDYEPTVIVPAAAWTEAFRKNKSLAIYRPGHKGEPPVTVAYD